MPAGHNLIFEALAPLAPTPFDEFSPNLVQGCGITRSFKIVKFRGVQKLGGSKFGNVHFCGQHELDKIFEGEVAETPNLQGKCTLVWHKCHEVGDPERSKLCPQGTITFFSLLPSSSDTL